jgi:hypothetical protein
VNLVADGLDYHRQARSVFGERSFESDLFGNRADPGNALRILDTGWDEKDIPLRPWVARGYLMRGAVTVLSGQGSAGKSSLVVAWTCCMALGAAFDRLKVREAVTVGVYNVEDDQDEQRRRFSGMAQRLSVPVAQIMKNVAILSPERIGTLVQIGPNGRTLVNTPVMDTMREWVIARRPDVLFLDPFVELHGSEENDNTAIRAVMAFLRSLAQEFAMAVAVLHHARKGEGTPGDPDSLRGASSIVGAARVVLTLNVMTDVEAKELNISASDRRDYFRLDDAKKNHARLEDVSWFERQERRLDNAVEDQVGDGVVVAWPWKPPSVWKDMSSEDIAAVLDKVAAGPAPGVLYTISRRGSGGRWVGGPIMEYLDINEEQAVKVAKAWVSSGLLTVTKYRDEGSRKDVDGLLVDRSRSP